MSNNKNDTKVNKKCILATSVTTDEKERITNLAREQKLTNAQYIRQTLELANEMKVNYPAVSTQIVHMNIMLDSSKDTMDESTYEQLKKYVNNLTKLLH